MGAVLHDLVFDYTLRTVALGAALLGLASGALGSFAMLRRQSLLGDAISHAALPGIALAFLLTESKHPVILTAGAGIAGMLGMLTVLGITNTTRLKIDSALGIVLSVFFGFGLVLLTFIQKLPTAAQAGLDTFLFGQAATLLTRDVLTIGVLGTGAILLVIAYWKELELLVFDRDFGASLGYPMQRIEVLLAVLLVTAIVIGLQAVGVVLMSALVVAPAAAARQWTNRLGPMVTLAAIFGMASGVGGTVMSSAGRGLPTGPLIVLTAGAFVTISLVFAPERGLLAQTIRRHRNQRRIHIDTVLVDLYALSRQHTDPDYAHPESSLLAMRPWRGRVRRSLGALAGRGLAREMDTRWAITPLGRATADEIIREGRVVT